MQNIAKKSISKQITVPVDFKIKEEVKIETIEKQQEVNFSRPVNHKVVELTYAQNREARSLAMFEYTKLQKVYETFILRTVDNKLVQNNEPIEIALGMIEIEIKKIHTILFSKDKQKSEYSKKKENEYLLSLIEMPV